jgi:16S rRNA (guanine527-N7)-methyltransferase
LADPRQVESLRVGARQLGVPLTEAQVQQLLAYRALLLRWNRVHNLTAITKDSDVVSHHLLDSLALVTLIDRHLGEHPARLLDVGSGGGLPGLVIAILRPALRVTTVDAVQKKCAFVTQAALELKLANVEVAHARVESLARPPFDLIVSRAFSSLEQFVTLSAHLLVPAGVWLAMKGKRPDAEMAALPSSVRVAAVEPLEVPGLDEQRCVVEMRRT